MSSSQCCSYGDTGVKGRALFASLQILMLFPLAPSFHFGFEDIETGEAIGLEEKKTDEVFIPKYFRINITITLLKSPLLISLFTGCLTLSYYESTHISAACCCVWQTPDKGSVGSPPLLPFLGDPNTPRQKSRMSKDDSLCQY